MTTRLFSFSILMLVSTTLGAQQLYETDLGALPLFDDDIDRSSSTLMMDQVSKDDIKMRLSVIREVVERIKAVYGGMKGRERCRKVSGGTKDYSRFVTSQIEELQQVMTNNDALTPSEYELIEEGIVWLMHDQQYTELQYADVSAGIAFGLLFLAKLSELNLIVPLISKVVWAIPLSFIFGRYRTPIKNNLIWLTEFSAAVVSWIVCILGWSLLAITNARIFGLLSDNLSSAEIAFKPLIDAIEECDLVSAHRLRVLIQSYQR